MENGCHIFFLRDRFVWFYGLYPRCYRRFIAIGVKIICDVCQELDVVAPIYWRKNLLQALYFKFALL